MNTKLKLNETENAKEVNTKMSKKGKDYYLKELHETPEENDWCTNQKPPHFMWHFKNELLGTSFSLNGRQFYSLERFVLGVGLSTLDGFWFTLNCTPARLIDPCT